MLCIRALNCYTPVRSAAELFNNPRSAALQGFLAKVLKY